MSSSEETAIIFGDGDEEEEEEDGLAGLEDITKTICNGEDESAQRIAADLSKYIELLPHAPSSFNALLDAEHNSNDDKARGLLRYYEERPNLLEYTLDKELPRMDYIWIDPETGEFIQDKTRIAGKFIEASRQEESYILPRCANQSLLADLLQFLTAGDDNALIRRQHHMAVNTRKVSIVVMPSNGTVLAKANLELSLPHPSQGLVNIATVHVSCQFSPLQSPPLFHYHVESVDLAESCPTEADLLDIAYFLHDLPSQLTVEEEEAAAAELNYSKRDAFLQRTKSSWKQMNASLTQKLFRGNGTGGASANNDPNAPRPFQKSQESFKRQMDRFKTVVAQQRSVNRSTYSTDTLAAESETDDMGDENDRLSNNLNAGWKKQQENLKKQLGRIKSVVGPNNNSSASGSEITESSSLSLSSMGTLPSVASEDPSVADATPPEPQPQETVRPSWKQKQENFKSRMNVLKSAVLEQAGSRAVSSRAEAKPEEVPEDSTLRQQKQQRQSSARRLSGQEVPEKGKWSGRLRTGWNRIAQSLPSKNTRAEGPSTGPVSESEELVFSSSPMSKDDVEEEVLFESPTSSAVPTVPAGTTDNTPVATPAAAPAAATKSRFQMPRPAAANPPQRRWANPRRLIKLMS
eukprot:CAMPEP_0172454792 /NCGR_PEP_ID=MMETSP1065-20121228/11676_1 /TAXON_ID=265537 /ORGANISM="Amphiprora paludosa, Strain CCMP125" /LENGTH=634 /DNA_ID=CAMNT_0013207181 /DNA_START=58 /DNA_END=1962 /DNA_ORIENTATION=+